MQQQMDSQLVARHQMYAFILNLTPIVIEKNVRTLKQSMKAAIICLITRVQTRGKEFPIYPHLFLKIDTRSAECIIN